MNETIRPRGKSRHQRNTVKRERQKDMKQRLTGETPFHRLKKLSVLMTLKKTVTILTFGALRAQSEEMRLTFYQVTHTILENKHAGKIMKYIKKKKTN